MAVCARRLAPPGIEWRVDSEPVEGGFFDRLGVHHPARPAGHMRETATAPAKADVACPEGNDEERDAAIEASDDVLDLRPALHERIKQRELAKVYRKPWGPPGGGRA